LRHRPVLRRHDRCRPTQHLVRGVAEHLLGSATPKHDLPVGIRADDRYRRRIDHGRERVLGGPQFFGCVAGLVVASFERLRHAIEVVRERSHLVMGVNRAAVTELAGRERGGVLAELPQRANDASRQHPGDGESRHQRAEDEERAPSQP
jgi:hypothetical protein